METITTEIVEAEKSCSDCGPADFDLSELETWSQEKLMAAILVELITMRVSLTQMGEGISAIGTQGIGGLLGGLFGGKTQ